MCQWLAHVIAATAQHYCRISCTYFLLEHLFKGNVYFTHGFAWHLFKGGDNLRAAFYCSTIENCFSSICIWVYLTGKTRCVSYYIKPVYVLITQYMLAQSSTCNIITDMPVYIFDAARNICYKIGTYLCVCVCVICLYNYYVVSHHNQGMYQKSSLRVRFWHILSDVIIIITNYTLYISY